MEHNTEIENEPREEIDADLAVEMVNSGFHVFIDKSDEQITYDMAFGDHPERFDFENHTFTAPMMEVAQYNATVALCEKFDSLNNDVRADIGRSLEDYADELFDNEESEFMWNNGLSEWENINTSILSGETEYLRNFLNDVSVLYSSRTADLLEDLNDYTAAYLNRNKVEHIPQQDNTYAYKTGGSAPFTIVYLDIGSQERKTAVTDALNNIINNVYGERTRYGEINPSSQPYRNLLEHVQNGEDFLHAFQGHLVCLKYALEHADTSRGLCAEMLESIRSAEKNPSPEIVIKGFSCRLVDEWEERGTSYSIGQDGAFYRAAVSDGTTFEYDFKPYREKVMSDHADKMAEVYMDHYEAEHGADGYAMFPDTEARTENIRQMRDIEEKMQQKKQAEHIPQQQDISHNNADPSAGRGERQNTMENKKLTEQGETQDKAAEPAQQEMDGWDYLYDYGSSKFGPDDTADLSAQREKRQNTMENKNLTEQSETQDKAAEPAQEEMNGWDDLYDYGSSKFGPDDNVDPSAKQRESKENIMEKFVAYYEKPNQERGFFLDEKENTIIINAPDYDTAQHAFTNIVDNWEEMNRSAGFKPTKGAYDFVVDFADNHKNLYYSKEYSCEDFGCMVEHIPQQQDISHNNADPSAGRGERKNTMNTKFEVSSMTMLDESINPNINPKVKAIASVAINNELIVSGITVCVKSNSNEKSDIDEKSSSDKPKLYIKMPQQKNGKDEQGKDKYEDRVFPSTKEARKALEDAVFEKFNDLQSKGLETFYIKTEPPEKPVSKLGVSLKKSEQENSRVKATGQITVDNCFVIKGVSVSADRVNKETGEVFQAVNLPHFKQNQKGEYPLVVKPVSKKINQRIKDAVMTNFNAQTRGVKFSELGGKEDTATYFRQNNQFAEKLMNNLESKGIPYHAKITDTTTISVKSTDKAAVESIRKEIANEGRKPSVIGEVNKIKAEQKANEAEKPAPQKAKSNEQTL